jgi:hypothetical protein
MGRLVYYADDCDNREASVIQLTIPNDLDISEFKIVCKRMASAMGYGPNSIEREFPINEYISYADLRIRHIVNMYTSGSY